MEGGVSHEVFSHVVLPLIYPPSGKLWRIDKAETEALRASFAGDEKAARASATNSNKNHNLTYGEVTPASIQEHVLAFHGAMGPKDVFYDLGSGDGKIMLQVLLATSAGAGKGIEFAEGREAGAQAAKQRLHSVSVEEVSAVLQALAPALREKLTAELLALPALPVASKGSAPAGSAAEGAGGDPDAPGSATPAPAAQDALAARRTPGSKAKRALFPPGTDGQEGVAPGVAGAALALHARLRDAGHRFHSLHGDFTAADFSDATHIFVNNTVFEPDLMLALREKLAAVPGLSALTLLRKLCYRHSRRCAGRGEACAAFAHPPEEGVCWPTWCPETTLFKYQPAGAVA